MILNANTKKSPQTIDLRVLIRFFGIAAEGKGFSLLTELFEKQIKNARRTMLLPNQYPSKSIKIPQSIC